MAISSTSLENPAIAGLTPRSSTAGTLSDGVERQRQATELRGPAERLSERVNAPESETGTDDVRAFVRLAQGLDPEEGGPRSAGEPAFQVGRDEVLPRPADSNRAQVIDIAV